MMSDFVDTGHVRYSNLKSGIENETDRVMFSVFGARTLQISQMTISDVPNF